MPNFGEFSKKQSEIKQNYFKHSETTESSKFDTNQNVNALDSSKVVRVKDVIGRALDKI